LADPTAAPVPQGKITTVRVASAVGTITARMPGRIVLTVVLLVAMMSATIRIATSATITTQTERLANGSTCVRGASSESALSCACASAIGILP
jgi:hypothetical protein